MGGAATNGPITLPRSHYAEDSLEKAIQADVCQYIILGAGLDTFAYRRPDLSNRLQIFELDHPKVHNRSKYLKSVG